MENKMMVMRMALRDISRVAEEMTRGTINKEPVDRKMVDAWAMRLCEIISRDLDIPLRNCDIYSWRDAWAKWRTEKHIKKPETYKEAYDGTASFMDWFMDSADKEGGADE